MDNLEKKSFNIPRLGQRIVKTAIAVFLCLLFYYLIGYKVPAEACITAIICMQPLVKDSGEYALNRLVGTLIGAVWGFLLLMLLSIFPGLSNNMPLLYLFMAIGVVLSLYSAVLIKKSDTASLAAIAFLCIVIAFPDVSNPVKQALARVSDVFVGMIMAILVNIVSLPRRKNNNLVFFVRAKDFIPGRFEQIDPAVQFRINKLCDDGAKICFISEHAPAFFTMQLKRFDLNVPAIVMDGAAIYDVRENAYLWTQTIEEENLLMLFDALKELELSYFIYTVHGNRTCIFHRGEKSSAERHLYDKLKSSPYRDYLDGDILNHDEVVYVKIVEKDEKIDEVERMVHRVLSEHRFRIVKRPQEGTPGVSGLYIYDHLAESGHARTVLMEMLSEEEPLQFEEEMLKNGYQSEHDALQLLNRVESKFEPIRFFGKKQ